MASNALKSPSRLPRPAKYLCGSPAITSSENSQAWSQNIQKKGEFIEYIKRLQTTAKEESPVTTMSDLPAEQNEETSDPPVSAELANQVFSSLGLNREEYEGKSLLAASNLILERARLLWINNYYKGPLFSVCYWNGS
jgi:hypothetical protein